MNFLLKYKFLLALYGIIVIAEILINPCGNFPLNDDWSYAKSVMILHNEGEINIGNWGAMTLVSHLLWGVAFTKIFGFSFFVLRVSTIISSVIGVTLLYRLVTQTTHSKFSGFVAAMVLFFNPIYFNLSNTYMTDVNFNTLVILFIYTAISFYKNEKLWLLIPLLALSIALVFLRQYGIIAPISFMLGSLFMHQRKLLYFFAALVLSAFVYYALKWYEAGLREYLASWAPYKFSEQVKLTDPEFVDRVIYSISTRYKTMIALVIIYLFPFVAFSLRSIVKASSKINLLLGFVIALGFSIFVLQGAEFPFRNVFMNTVLGPETFCESWSNNIQHNRSSNFNVYITVFKCLFFFGSTFSLVLIFLNVKNRLAKLIKNPIAIFLSALFFSYIFMLLITESFFDRYHLPLVSIGMISFAFLTKNHSSSWRIELFPLLVCIYISIAGTRDYFELNTKRWEAYYYLRNQNIESENINGGFEVNCWNDGKMNWWFDFVDPQKFNYVIQFNAPQGFVPFKEYSFQRYFPYRKDTVYIFSKSKNLNPTNDSNVIVE